MRLLMLPRYEALGASSRLRMLQYIPALQAQGIKVDVASLLDDRYVTDLYAGTVSTWNVLCAYLRRLRWLLSVNDYDAVWLEKELFPWLPAVVRQYWGAKILARSRLANAQICLRSTLIAWNTQAR